MRARGIRRCQIQGRPTPTSSSLAWIALAGVARDGPANALSGPRPQPTYPAGRDGTGHGAPANARGCTVIDELHTKDARADGKAAAAALSSGSEPRIFAIL